MLVFILFIPTMLANNKKPRFFNFYRARNTKCQFLAESPCRVVKIFELSKIYKMTPKIGIIPVIQNVSIRWKINFYDKNTC